MEAFDKLKVLGEGAQFEVASSATNKAKSVGTGVGAAALCSAKEMGKGGGRATKLLRVLQTNRCDRGCSYCPLRSQNDGVARVKFAPEELASLFLQFESRRMADGLFLSSGSDGSADASMEEMVKTVAILREKYRYSGYIHLKVLPGTSLSLIEEAARLSNRLSVNMEAPTAERLSVLDDQKNFFQDIVSRMEWIERLRQEHNWLPAGQSTQLIVGAGQETDHEILKTASWLYRDMKLNRVYYGAFAPAAGTPLENQAPTRAGRQQRLYQSDWLLEQYGFGFEELPFTTSGNLPLGIDPKVAWAFLHPERFPIEVNRADMQELLRVPGIGPLSARRIITLRGTAPFKTLETLKHTGVVLKRARDFITINGSYWGVPLDLLARAGQSLLKAADQPASPATPPLHQLTLPFDWSRDMILPPRLSTKLSELSID